MGSIERLDVVNALADDCNLSRGHLDDLGWILTAVFINVGTRLLLDFFCHAAQSGN